MHFSIPNVWVFPDISKLYVNLFVLRIILRLRESQVKIKHWRITGLHGKYKVPLRDLMLFENICFLKGTKSIFLWYPIKVGQGAQIRKRGKNLCEFHKFDVYSQNRTKLLQLTT